MRKKSVFLSKVFAVALAASMAFNTPYASAALVESSTVYEETDGSVIKKDSAFFSNWSDFYRVSGDFDVTIELSNKSDGAAAWNNYVLVFASPIDYTDCIANPAQNISDYQEYCVLRADNGGWGGGDNTTSEGNPITYAGLDIDNTFTETMKDAKVSLNIVRTGQDVTIRTVMEGTNSQTLNKTTTFKLTPESINLFITGEKADINILSYTVKKNNGVEVGVDVQNPCEKIEFIPETEKITRVVGVPFEVTAELTGKDNNKAVTDIPEVDDSKDCNVTKKSYNGKKYILNVTPTKATTEGSITVSCSGIKSSTPYTFEAVENKVEKLVSSKEASFTAVADQQVGFTIKKVLKYANLDVAETPITATVITTGSSIKLDPATKGTDKEVKVYATIKEGSNQFKFECKDVAEPLIVTITGIKGSGTTTTPTPGDTNKPSDDTNKPSDDTNKPSDDTNKPSDDTNKPSDDTNKPSDDTNKPSDDTNKPSDDTNKPSTTTKKKKASVKSAKAKKGKKVVSATIKLSSGKVVKNATVKVYVNNKKKATTKTNSKGKFSVKLSKKLKKGDKVKLVITKSTIKKITKTIKVK